MTTARTLSELAGILYRIADLIDNGPDLQIPDTQVGVDLQILTRDGTTEMERVNAVNVIAARIGTRPWTSDRFHRSTEGAPGTVCVAFTELDTDQNGARQ